jgi:hypothetical protein
MQQQESQLLPQGRVHSRRRVALEHQLRQHRQQQQQQQGYQCWQQTAMGLLVQWAG